MTDMTFEALLTGQLREYAEAGVRPIDRYAIAEGTIASGRRRGISWRWSLGQSRRSVMLVLVGLLILALAASAALIGARRVAETPPATDFTVRETALTVHRSGHTATRLDDGRVLITGGFSGYPSDDTAQAEIYDPVTGTFAPTGAMAHQVQQGTSTLLSDGRVLVVGGLETDEVYAARASAEVYDPATGRFDAVGSLATPRFGHASVRLLDGRVAIIGGSDSSSGATPSIELYDPTTRTFAPGPTDPRLARAGASAVVMDDGRVLVVGGVDPATGSGDPAIYAAGVLYDPVSGSLSSTAPLKDGPAFISPGRPVGPAIKSADGSVLVAIEVTTDEWGLTSFDPATASFKYVTSLDGDPGPRVPVLLADGRVFFVLRDQADCRVFKAAIFDPSSGLAKVVGEVPGIGGCNVAPASTVTVLDDGSVLVAGGNISGGESTEHASVIRVNP